MTDKKSPWDMTAAEEAEWMAENTRIREASPEYPEIQRRRKNIGILSDIFAQMVYPQTPATDWEITNKKATELAQCLRRCCLRDNANSTEGFASIVEAISSSRLNHIIIDEACSASRWPFKVGASLYIYQQMVHRERSSEPSLGKAQWLLTYAPMAGAKLSLRNSRGDAGQIGKQWKHYFTVAHYWAAFVVLNRNPLAYETTAPLQFICNADAKQFLSLASTFFHFRKTVNVKLTRRKGQSLPYIKQGLYGDFDEGDAKSPNDVPDLLSDYQWSALDLYEPNARKG